MSAIRPRRVSDLVRSEVASIILNGEIRDPRIGFVSIIDVTTSSDLSFCKIYFSVMTESQEAIDLQVKVLNKAKKFIRLLLGKRLKLRVVPEIVFIHDGSIAYGNKMDKLIDELDIAKQVTSASEEDFVTFLHQNDRFLLVSHVDPDGDTLGSAIGLQRLLGKLGKEAALYCPSTIPDSYKFLLADGTHFLSDEELQSHYGCVIILDMNQKERAGGFLTENVTWDTFAIIDHHLSPTTTAYNSAYVDATSGATGLLIYRLAKKLDVELDAVGANALYTAIITDTGGFRYESTTEEIFLAAAGLVRLGARPWDLARSLYENHPRKRMEFLSEALNSLEINDDHGYASISLPQTMFEKHGVTVDQAEFYDGFINFPRSIRGVEIAIQFREIDATTTKASFRSAGSVDVSGIAMVFGGGGHHNAAGCTLNTTFDEAKARIVAQVEKALNEFRSAPHK